VSEINVNREKDKERSGTPAAHLHYGQVCSNKDKERPKSCCHFYNTPSTPNFSLVFSYQFYHSAMTNNTQPEASMIAHTHTATPAPA